MLRYMGLNLPCLKNPHWEPACLDDAVLSMIIPFAFVRSRTLIMVLAPSQGTVAFNLLSLAGSPRVTFARPGFVFAASETFVNNTNADIANMTDLIIASFPKYCIHNQLS